MNAKELRIGNLVKHLNSICRVEYIMGQLLQVKNDFEDWNPDTEECEPIPLTEQRLIKFGFKYDENRGYNSEELERKIYSYKGFDLTIEKNGEIRIWNECDDKWYYHYGKELKFVHKLQNYFY